MTQVCGHGIHARPAAALSAAGINIQNRVPGLSLLTRLDTRHGIVALEAVFAAKYVEVAQNNARDIRRSSLSTFALKDSYNIESLFLRIII